MQKEGMELLQSLVQKDLGLENDLVFPGAVPPDMAWFRQKLQDVVAYLIENDFHRLLNAMYRLDIQEQRFHEAMQAPDRDLAASMIADLILEREMQKVQSRLHYRKYRKF